MNASSALYASRLAKHKSRKIVNAVAMVLRVKRSVAISFHFGAIRKITRMLVMTMATPKYHGP